MIQAVAVHLPSTGDRRDRWTTSDPKNAELGYRPGPGTQGHTFKASYSPFDARTLSVTYYLAELIDSPNSGTSRDPESEMSRIQIDAVWKFQFASRFRCDRRPHALGGGFAFLGMSPESEAGDASSSHGHAKFQAL